MIDFYESIEDLDAVEIVYSKNATLIVVIAEIGEALTFTSLGIFHQFQVGDDTILGEDYEDIRFLNVKGKPTDENIGRIAIVIVPRSVVGSPVFEFSEVYVVNLANSIHGETKRPASFPKITLSADFWKNIEMTFV